ncbi:MAG: pyridoxamine 5'-phosphate oxidase family protein, partial [Spirochaetota bacterium]
MDSRSMLDALERVLEDSKIAILATVDPDGSPHMRWMTPAVVRGRDGFLYAVTSPEFEKTTQIDGNPRVEWMVQSKSLDEIVTTRGTMGVIDNPSVKAEVLEAMLAEASSADSEEAREKAEAFRRRHLARMHDVSQFMKTL